MNCEELQDHYELFAIGVAEEPERGEIRAHLNRGCEVCMAGVKGAMEIVALVGSTPVPAQPPKHLRRRILASVGVEKRGFGWMPVWAAAAALLALVAVYFANGQRRSAQEAQRLAQEEQTLRDQLRSQTNELARLTEAFAILNGPETKEATFGNTQPKPPRGKVFVNPTQGVLLMASNLPPAPSGKLYEMWMIPKSGKPLPAGLFQSETNGTAMHVHRGAVDLGATGAVAVTVENEQGADQPTTQPLIVAALANLPQH
jgi:hypothetical protein